MSRLPVNNFPSSRGTSSTTCSFHDERGSYKRISRNDRLPLGKRRSRRMVGDTGDVRCSDISSRRGTESPRFLRGGGRKNRCHKRRAPARLPVAHSYARLIAAPHCAAQRRVPRTHGLVRARPHACVHLAARYARFFRIVRIRCAPRNVFCTRTDVLFYARQLFPIEPKIAPIMSHFSKNVLWIAVSRKVFF